MPRFQVVEKTEWRWWVTPKLLRDSPVHRWFTFPHSFSPELVHTLIDEWNLGPNDTLLDPFAGAGTTILAAKEKGVSARGYDLSPLAVFVSKVKTAEYSSSRLADLLERLGRRVSNRSQLPLKTKYGDLVMKALSGGRIQAFDQIKYEIEKLPPGGSDFFLLALLATLPAYSDAVAAGGWLKWIRRRVNPGKIPASFLAMAEDMISEIPPKNMTLAGKWLVRQSDARALPEKDGVFTAVITSPPYPNRHDYTRVFGLELMFAFSDPQSLKQIRYQSFHSHPEAHPTRPDHVGYGEPRSLKDALRALEGKHPDPRVLKMLKGYFLDMFLSLKEMRRVCREGARIALIVGNAQYNGIAFMVDELTAEIGEQAGLRCQKLLAARYRGNSAQQMKFFGRRPSRESVVVFSVPRG